MRTKLGSVLFFGALGVSMLTAEIVRADSYVNFTTYKDGFSISTNEVGNQVYFTGGNTSVSVTNFSLQFFGKYSSGDSLEIRFYGVTGAAQNGYSYTPGPMLFDSGPIDLSFINGSTVGMLITLPNDGDVNDLPVGGVTVPNTFIFTVQFAGPDANSNNDGIALYGPSPSDGGNFGNAWVLDDPNTVPGWSLVTNANTSLPFDIGAGIEATPEPSSLALLGLGGLAGLAAVRFGTKRRLPIH